MNSLIVKASLAATQDVTAKILLSCYRLRGQFENSESDLSAIISEIEALSDVCAELKDAVPPEDSDDKSQAESGNKPEASKKVDSKSSWTKCKAALDACHVALKELAELLEPLVKPRQRGKQAKWPLDSSQIHQNLEIVEKQNWELEVLVSELNPRPSEETSSGKSDTAMRRPEVLQWYKTSDPEQNQLLSKKARQADTGTWVFENEVFNHWKSSPAGELLWLHGIPGAGKTVLCSTIIDHMQQFCEDSSNNGVLPCRAVYFYFDFSDNNKQSVKSLIKSCIAQLIAANKGPTEAAETMYTANKDNLNEPSVEEFQSILMAEFALTERTFVLIDALDECPQKERAYFIEHILQPLRSANANILITSRKEVDIEKSLSSIASTISIQDAVVDSDIRTYVDTLISNDQTLNSMGPAIKKEISEGIVAGSRGMFRWAICQLDTIKTCLTPAMVRSKLKSMPADLDETYHQILSRIPASHQSFVQAALHWLAFSARPLLLEELAEAAAMRPESGCFDPESTRLLHHNMIMDLCGLLVSSSELDPKKTMPRYIREKGWTETRGRNDAGRQTVVIVSLSHYTVKEFIMTARLKNSSLSVYHISPTIGHSYLAQCCLLYLLEFNKGKVAGQLAYQTFVEHPLLQYASRFWMEHWENAEDEHDRPPVRTLYHRLLWDECRDECRDAYLNWLNIWNPDTRWEEYPENPKLSQSADLYPQPLYWASSLGDFGLVRSMVDAGADISAREGHFESALGAAVFFRRYNIVDYFLEKGLDPNLPGTNFGNLLQIAIVGGCEEVVRRLIESGADVNAGGGQWTSPLIAAAAKQRQDLVELLISHGADINQGSQSLGSALFQAVKSGDINTVTVLLGAGADPNGSGSHGEATPLYAAAEGVSFYLVQLLLKKGADVNKESSTAFLDDGYPLIVAARKGHLEIVRTLLLAGADVDLKSKRQDSALQAAISSRDMAVFQTVLDAGPNLNNTGSFYISLFQQALSCRQFDMAKILLERGADPGHGTLVTAAEVYNQEQWPLEILLKRKDIDVDFPAPYGGSCVSTPLHAAVDCFSIDRSKRVGSYDAVRLLLEHNAYVNCICQRSYTTPICRAILNGDVRMTKLLLEYGADFRRTINYSPLEVAVYSACKEDGPMELVTILLDLGVDINADTEMAPYWPTLGPKHDILRYLVKRGLKLDRIMLPPTRIQGGFGLVDYKYRRLTGTPLQMAACEANIEGLKLLLELGADIDAPRDKEPKTLHFGLLSKDKDTVEFLISNGARLDDSLKDQSILCKAINNNLGYLVAKLIEMGADVNATEHNESPLAAAFALKDMDLVNLLKGHGARFSDTDSKLPRGILERGTLEDLKLLLEHGFNPKAFGFANHECIAAASKKTDLEAIRLLVDHGADLKTDRALLETCKSGHLQMAEFLIDNNAGANFNKALDSACGVPNNLAIINMLLVRGATVSADDGSCFRAAGRSGCQRIMTRLLQESMTEVERCHFLGLALQEAAEKCQISYCMWLLETLDAPVNHSGPPYGSPLQAVMTWQSRDADTRIILIRSLIQKGADINPPLSHRPGKEISSAKSAALLGYGWLIDSSPTYAPPLSLALLGDSYRGGIQHLATELLAQGADPNGEGGQYHRPLQAAAVKYPKMIGALLDAGAEINAVGGNWGTALHAAAYKRDAESVRLLLARGADVSIVEGKVGSVMAAAASGGGRDDARNIEVMELLLAAGADVNASGGEKGSSAVYEAAVHGNLGALQWLVSKGADIRAKGGEEGNVYKAAMKNAFNNMAVEWHIVSWLEQHYGREGWD